MESSGIKEKGKATKTWRRSCELEMEANGHSWSDLTQMARDRDGWRMKAVMRIGGSIVCDVKLNRKKFIRVENRHSSKRIMKMRM